MISIREATAADLGSLPAIERAAAAQFSLTRYPDMANAPLASEAINTINDRVWVAISATIPVAFVIARAQKDAVHIQEIDVHPDYARRGIGAQLIHALQDWAKQRFAYITLTTFDDVPWNAPYYTRLGFVLMPRDTWTDALHSVRRAERQAGFPMKHRVCMRLQIA